MGLQDFLHDLVPKRWRDKLGPDGLSQIPGFAGGNLGEQVAPQIPASIPSGDTNAPRVPISTNTLDIRPSLPEAPPPPIYRDPGAPPTTAISPTLTATDAYHAAPFIKPQPDREIVDPMERQTAYRNAVEDWQPDKKRSVGNTLKGAGLGFLAGGLGGAVYGGVGSLIKPNLTGQFEKAGMTDRANATLDRQYGEAARQASLENAQIKPRLEMQDYQLRRDANQQKTVEAERDNLRQIYNSLPNFDVARNPQHRAIAERAAALGMTLPDRAEKDQVSVERFGDKLYTVDKRAGTATPLNGLVDATKTPTTINVSGREFTVTPNEAANILTGNQRQAATIQAQREQQDRGFQFQGQQSAAEAQGAYASADQADSDAKNAQTSLEQMERDLSSIPAMIQVGNQVRENPEYVARKQQIAQKHSEYQALRQSAIQARKEANKAAGKSKAVRPMPQSSSPSRPKLSEGDVRAAASAKGLDPDKAVQRARVRGQL